MASAIVQILPIILGGLILPAPIIISLLLLRRTDGLAAAGAFVAGMTVVRLLQGAFAGSLLR
jgi:hypothetical protein